MSTSGNDQQDLQLQEAVFNVPPSFGRTHFIVGFPQDRTVTPDHTQPPSGGVYQVLFSPDDDVQRALLNFIANEQTHIQAAIFMLTDQEIADALLAAAARGVIVEIVTDQGCVQERCGKMGCLHKGNIPVYVYQPTSTGRWNDLMHHKFVIFGKTTGGKSLVWTGSFNWTRSARKHNQEHVVVLDDTQAIEKFTQQFAVLKQRSVRAKVTSRVSNATIVSKRAHEHRELHTT